jgi:hypothetical protein
MCVSFQTANPVASLCSIKLGCERSNSLESKVNIVLGWIIRLDIFAPGNVRMVRFTDCGLAQIGLLHFEILWYFP